MLASCLAMLETEQDQRRFIKLYNTYEKKIYLTALLLLSACAAAAFTGQLSQWFPWLG